MTTAPGAELLRERQQKLHAWYPVSPCGAGCVPDDAERVSPIIVGWRILRLLGVLLVAASAAVVTVGCPRLVRRVFLRRVAREVLAALGLRIEIDDRRPFVSHARGLVVANHVSYLDIPALAVIHPAHFVAKFEVATMPVIATLARRFGVITIDRSALSSLPRSVDEAVDLLERDAAVAVFPEGTTRCGRTAGTFAPAFFEAAVRARVPVIPMRVEYVGPDGAAATAPAFIGDDSAADTFRRVLWSRGLTVRVTIRESLLPGPDRRELADRCSRIGAGLEDRTGNGTYDSKRLISHIRSAA